MSKLENLKNIYQSIEPPAKLNYIVSSTIDMAVKQKKSKQLVWFKPLIGSMAAAFILFVILLNSSPVFAKSVYDIPVLSSVARVFTFREYSHSDEGYEIDIKTPAIEGTGHMDLEKRINLEIQSKINLIRKNVEKRAEENKEEILKNGGTEADLRYFTVEVNYEIKSSNENILSFVNIEDLCYQLES